MHLQQVEAVWHFFCKESSKIVLIFTSVHRVCWGRGSMVAARFKKMLIMMDCICIWGSLKINIFKELFWEGGGHKKSTLCALLIILSILDDP